MYLTTSRIKKLDRNNPNEWLENITVDVHCYPESIEHDDMAVPVLAARMSGLLLDVSEAQDDGESIYDIFDADSSELEALYSMLFDTSSDHFDPDLRDGGPGPIEVIYLEHSVFHPALKEWRCFLLDHFCNLFSFMAVIAIWDTLSFSTVELSDDEFAKLGFHTTKTANFRIRSNELKHDYAAADDMDRVSSLVVPNSAPEYIERQWKLVCGETGDD